MTRAASFASPMELNWHYVGIPPKHEQAVI